MIDESYILIANGCEAGPYTSRDEHLRLIGVERMSASASRRLSLRRIHSILFHTKDEEDSGKGLFESTSEVAPLDEGDRIGVVEFSLRRHSEAPQVNRFFLSRSRVCRPYGCM
jgi:hypothetical protein